MAIDFEAEGLLEGLDDQDARAARLRLLERLESDGVPLEELKRAAREDRLVFLPVERALADDGPRYSAREVAERAGVEEDFLLRLYRSMGLATADPGEPVYGDADVTAAQAIQAFREAGLPDDGLLEVARVIGNAMARIAEVTGDMFAEAFFQEGDTELDTAVRYAQMVEQVRPGLTPLLDYVLRLHEREHVRQAVGFAELASGGLAEGREISVCFADLVGFTRLGEQVPADQLGALAGRFSEMAAAVAEHPVRLVKMIGDAAMLVSPEPDALLAAGLGLIEAAEEAGDEFPQVRVGVAHGRALSRAGDWYGRPINLASRVTGLARRGSLLATEDVKEAAKADAFSWSDAGRFRLKGVSGRVPLWRVRPAEPPR